MKKPRSEVITRRGSGKRAPCWELADGAGAGLQSERAEVSHNLPIAAGFVFLPTSAFLSLSGIRVGSGLGAARGERLTLADTTELCAEHAVWSSRNVGWRYRGGRLGPRRAIRTERAFQRSLVHASRLLDFWDSRETQFPDRGLLDFST